MRCYPKVCGCYKRHIAGTASSIAKSVAVRYKAQGIAIDWIASRLHYYVDYISVLYVHDLNTSAIINSARIDGQMRDIAIDPIAG